MIQTREADDRGKTKNSECTCETDAEHKESGRTGSSWYRMSRDIETVPDLWREWTRGIDGAEPVRELVRQWGTRWRETSQTENSFFCRRKVILDASIESQDSDQMVVDLEVRRHME